jgi:hypothetical protein
MFRSIRALVVIALAFSGVWIAGGAAPAHAFTGYQVVERTYSLPAFSFVRQIAPCPSGTVVLGGGAAVVGSGSAQFNTQLQESAPGTNSNGSLWLATVGNGTANNYTLGVFAVCGAAPSGYQVVYNTVALPTFGFVRQGVSCPPGKVALAGGASVVGEGSADFNTLIEESSPGSGSAGSFWLTSVTNVSVNTHTVALASVCADPPTGYQVVQTSVNLPATNLSGTGFVRTTAACPAGKVVFGGGAAVTGAGSQNFGTEMEESSPGTVSGRSIWLAAVVNTDNVDYTLGLFAVCVS